MENTNQNIPLLVIQQQQYFNSGATKPYGFRLQQLKKLKAAIIDQESELTSALKKDLGKSDYEAYTTEIGIVLQELTHTIKHLKRWMKPQRVRTPLVTQPARSQILLTPLGVNLIISPYNYPIQLTLSPLVAAIAAGNAVVIKTSELTPHCSKSIQNLIELVFEPDYIVFIEGAVPETTLLLEQKFNHIFFTGSQRVGSIILTAAAKHLTPVTLELGGKSPCIVHKDANLDIAVNRIVFGKFTNAGQTCVAPDYILVHKSIKEQFLDKIKLRIQTLYGIDASQSPDYGRIVNTQHFQRILKLIDKNKVVVGGQSNGSDKFIAPTVLTNIDLSDDIMKEEIFGPLLPVLEYEDIEECQQIIAQLPQHPLACYIFSENKTVQNELLSSIQFGGGCINHCLIHLANHHLPFGGVGESGMGSYHGFSGFERFSHKKSILKAPTWFDIPLLYPPFKGKLKYIRLLLR